MIRQTTRHALLPLLLLTAGLGGCGSPRQPIGGPQTTAGEGAVRIRIAWPAQDPAGRMIPQIATTVEVEWASDTGEKHGSKRIDRPDDQWIFERVPSGWMTIKAASYAGTNPTPLSTGTARVLVKPNETNSVPIELESTITTVTVDPATVSLGNGETAFVVATARNAQGAMVLSDGFGWSLAGDTAAVSFEQGPNNLTLTGQQAGTVAVTAKEQNSGKSATATVTVTDRPNEPPVVLGWMVDPDPVPPGATAQIAVNAHDPDGDDLTYTWQAAAGTLSGTGATVSWTAPGAEGTYDLTVSIKDPKHPEVPHTLPVVVSVGKRFVVTELSGFTAHSMNNRGQLVGAGADSKPCVWENGQITPLSTGGMRYGAAATDINDQGVVIGHSYWRNYFYNASVYLYHAIRWVNGQPETLSGAWYPGPMRINNLGHYIGDIFHRVYDDGGPAGEPYGCHAARDGQDLGAPPIPYYTFDVVNGGVIRGMDLPGVQNESSAFGINDAGTVVGDCGYEWPAGGRGPLRHAARWDSGAMVDLDAGKRGTSRALAINNTGRVVGYYMELAVQWACQWAGGVRSKLPVPADCTSSEATSINNTDQIVGRCITASTDLHGRAVLWENGVVTDLNSIAEVPEGVVLVSAIKVNDPGQILCRGRKGDANVYYLLTPRGSRVPRRR
jgi:uncharacterized membrane protein